MWALQQCMCQHPLILERRAKNTGISGVMILWKVSIETISNIQYINMYQSLDTLCWTMWIVFKAALSNF